LSQKWGPLQQLALFEAELKAQGVNVEDLTKGNDTGNGPDDKIRQPRPAARKRSRVAAVRCPRI